LALVAFGRATVAESPKRDRYERDRDPVPRWERRHGR
jgi:hypothetical protein